MQDLLLDEDYDIITEDGDLAVGTTDYQHQSLILKSSRGEWKQHPGLGVGLGDMVNDERPERWKSEIIEQMEADNMIVREVDVTRERVVIDAEYR